MVQITLMDPVSKTCHSVVPERNPITRDRHQNPKPPFDSVLLELRGAELGRSHPSWTWGHIVSCVRLTKLSRESWTLKGGILTTTGTTEALRRAHLPREMMLFIGT
jgi:hypothetical protein